MGHYECTMNDVIIIITTATTFNTIIANHGFNVGSVPRIRYWPCYLRMAVTPNLSIMLTN